MHIRPSEIIVADALKLSLDPAFLVNQGRQPGEVLTNAELGDCAAHDVLMGIIRSNVESGSRTQIPSFVETGRAVTKLLNDLESRGVKC